MYFLGLDAYHQNINSASAYFDRALEIDPANVDALIYRGGLDLMYAISWLSDDPLSRLRSAEATFVKALRLRPDDARAHAHFGAVCAVTKRLNRGVSECERALAIDRNCVWAHVWIGMAKYVLGRNDETEAHILEALRLSPRDRSTGSWFQIVGFAKLGAGRDEEAIRWFSRAMEDNPNLPMSHFLLAAASAHLGRMDEAHARWAQGSNSTRVSPSRDSGPKHSATTPSTSRAASGCTKACARLGFPGADASPNACLNVRFFPGAALSYAASMRLAPNLGGQRAHMSVSSGSP
jgi:tetratricopeptide (TPR) repeat protein